MKVDLNRIIESFHTRIELYTSKGVIRELERIAKSGKKVAPYAALALKVIDKEKIKIEENTEYPDIWLLKQENIATVDVPLIKKARMKGLRVITISESGRISIK